MPDDLSTRKTVGELIAELSKFPPDMPIMVYDFQRQDKWIPDPVVKIAKVQVSEYSGRTHYEYPSRSRDAHIIDIVSIDL